MGAIADFAVAGGPVIWLLMVLSFVSLALIALKAFDLARVSGGRTERESVLKQLQSPVAWRPGAVSVSTRTPADRVLRAALDADAAGLSETQIESELAERGNREVARMARYLRLLEVIAMVGPLLGLLGTVLGMIEAFQQLELEGGSANAAVLAGGIWKALLTTAAGLIVAIPAAVAAHLFGARVEGATVAMEDVIRRAMSARQAAPRASGG